MGAKINLQSDLPVIIAVDLHHGANVTTSERYSPFAGQERIYISRPFMHMDVTLYIFKGMIYLKVGDGGATLYPIDNAYLFTSLICWINSCWGCYLKN